MLLPGLLFWTLSKCNETGPSDCPLVPSDELFSSRWLFKHSCKLEFCSKVVGLATVFLEFTFSHSWKLDGTFLFLQPIGLFLLLLVSCSLLHLTWDEALQVLTSLGHKLPSSKRVKSVNTTRNLFTLSLVCKVRILCREKYGARMWGSELKLC